MGLSEIASQNNRVYGDIIIDKSWEIIVDRRGAELHRARRPRSTGVVANWVSLEWVGIMDGAFAMSQLVIASAYLFAYLSGRMSLIVVV